MGETTWLKNNFLFYLENNKNVKKIQAILGKLEIPYVSVQLHRGILTKQFVETLVEFCDEGFDTIVRPSIEGFDDLTYTQAIAKIMDDYPTVLKNQFFLGKVGTEYKVTSGLDEDNYTVHVPFEKREMSKIYD